MYFFFYIKIKRCEISAINSNINIAKTILPIKLITAEKLTANNILLLLYQAGHVTSYVRVQTHNPTNGKRVLVNAVFIYCHRLV